MYIKTERLELKPLSDCDCENMIEIFTDDIIKKTYLLPDFESKEKAIELFERFKKLSEMDDYYLVGIYLEDEVIGFVNEVSRENGSIELGYVIHPKYHNNGYASEMLGAMIEAMFDAGLSEVVTGAFEENVASIRVMQKNGMIKIDKTEDIDYRGAVHKCVFYSKRAIK